MSADPASEVARVAIGLNAVVIVVDGARPRVLCRRGQDGALSLPYGPFDPNRHRTFEIGLREWVERQTSIELGYVEQLYTFGDKGREAPTAALVGRDAGERIVSVGYLALAPEAAAVRGDDAQWRDWYEFFPFEDWRDGEPEGLSHTLLPALDAWAEEADGPAAAAARRARLALAFGAEGWEEERALDRFELMYEAGLVAEAHRDRKDLGAAHPPLDAVIAGRPMASDHRRILATAIGRVRGKLKYRPVIFRLAPARFTLLELQRDVEAIVGFPLHKQNFRRHVEASGFAERTGELTQPQTGRPAALFRASAEVRKDLSTAGLAIPRFRTGPTFFGAPATAR